ncbi:MAG: Increased rDNA silencing protein [Candelina submexicana]|nr:MAG: Increased rDNA silencing protein [Candelina submexicana]
MSTQPHHIRGHSQYHNDYAGQAGAHGDHSAALRGASLAFGTHALKAKPLVQAHTGTFGALAAAKKAEGEDKFKTNGLSITESSAQEENHSGDSKGIAGAGTASLSAAAHSVGRERLRVLADPKKQTSSLGVRFDGRRSASPSNIAATLAAARSAPQMLHTETSNRLRSNTKSDDERRDILPPSGTVRNIKQLFAQPSGNQHDREIRIQSRGQPTSTATTEYIRRRSSINPANTLIEFYEQKTGGTDNDKSPLLKSINAAPVIRSPKPYRPPSSSKPPLPAALSAIHSGSSSHGALDVSTVKTQLIGPHGGAGLPTVSVRYASKDPNYGRTTNKDPGFANHETRRSTVDAGSPKGTLLPKPPVPRKFLRSKSVSTVAKSTALDSQYGPVESSTGSYASAPTTRSKPALPPPRRKGPTTTIPSAPGSDKPPLRHAAMDEAVNMSQKGLSKPKPIDIPQRGLNNPTRPLPSSRARSWVDDVPSSGDSSRYRSGRERQAFPHMTEDSLANAIVASSLASSRASSPAVSPQPPLPARHTKHHHYFHHESHTPSPPKAGMRHTMRGPPRSDDEDESSHKRGRKNLIKKHPHKHHEADRKRWRDQLTERERKRYEGVWAANKGLHVLLPLTEISQLPPSQQPLAGKDLVAAPVVRDIWSRSRLPSEVLQEVWDLVDGTGNGRLEREEFVVGLWLIDQSLKGRKLPIKVSESVWGSVRRLGGIKVPKRRK